MLGQPFPHFSNQLLCFFLRLCRRYLYRRCYRQFILWLLARRHRSYSDSLWLLLLILWAGGLATLTSGLSARCSLSWGDPGCLWRCWWDNPAIVQLIRFLWGSLWRSFWSWSVQGRGWRSPSQEINANSFSAIVLLVGWVLGLRFWGSKETLSLSGYRSDLLHLKNDWADLLL